MLDTFKITERKNTVLNIKKSIGIDQQKARVVVVFDYSGSMSMLYADGTVQATAERILPLGLAFDDDGQVDAYIFENGYHKLPENITLKNLDNYVNNKIVGKYRMGGTEYAPVINDIIEQFGNPTSKGWFSSATINAAPEPTYVIFFTDGENSDKSAAEKAMKAASEHAIFFQFVGIGRENFQFLQKLDDLKGRKVDNANFFKVENLNAVSDDSLYKSLMAEFPIWLREARSANILS